MFMGAARQLIHSHSGLSIKGERKSIGKSYSGTHPCEGRRLYFQSHDHLQKSKRQSEQAVMARKRLTRTDAQLMRSLEIQGLTNSNYPHSAVLASFDDSVFAYVVPLLAV